MDKLILSIFPGRDLLGTAFQQEGFCVVTAGDKLIGNLIEQFHGIPDKFYGVVGGPPCKSHSQAVLGHLPTEGDLTGEYIRVIKECEPFFYLYENVVDAPSPLIAGYFVSSYQLDAWEFGAKQRRKRKIVFGCKKQIMLDFSPYILDEDKRYQDPYPTVLATEQKFSANSTDRRRAGRHIKRRLTIEEVIDLMGLNPAEESHVVDSRYLTIPGKYQLYGNGVELNMGRAIARAIKNEISTTSIC